MELYDAVCDADEHIENASNMSIGLLDIGEDQIESDVQSNREDDATPDDLVNECLEITLKKPKIYPCPKCEKMFAQFPSAQKHCHDKTVKKSTCLQCGMSIMSKNMKRHKGLCEAGKSVRPKSSIKCSTCDKVLSSRQRLESHMEKVHKLVQEEHVTPSLKLSRCTKCDFSHNKVSVVKVHMSKFHPTGIRIQCEKCNFQCYSGSGMNKHYEKVHQILKSRKEVVQKEKSNSTSDITIDKNVISSSSPTVTASNCSIMSSDLSTGGSDVNSAVSSNSSVARVAQTSSPSHTDRVEIGHVGSILDPTVSRTVMLGVPSVESLNLQPFTINPSLYQVAVNPTGFSQNHVYIAPHFGRDTSTLVPYLPNNSYHGRSSRVLEFSEF